MRNITSMGIEFRPISIVLEYRLLTSALIKANRLSSPRYWSILANTGSILETIRIISSNILSVERRSWNIGGVELPFCPALKTPIVPPISVSWFSLFYKLFGILPLLFALYRKNKEFILSSHSQEFSRIRPFDFKYFTEPTYI